MNDSLYFTRATTPSFKFQFLDEDTKEVLDISDFEDIRITFKQYENTLLNLSTKSGTATIVDNAVYVELTQDETLRFQQGTCYVQPHLLRDDGETYADKTPIKIMVYDILDGGTI